MLVLSAYFASVVSNKVHSFPRSVGQQGKYLPADEATSRRLKSKGFLDKTLIIGCSLLDSKSLNGYGGASGFPNITKFTGSPLLDANITQEYFFMESLFSATPEIYAMDDYDSPNAFATPELIKHNKPDGTILIGLNLMSKEMERSGQFMWGTQVIISIMAHEFAHIWQFKNNKNNIQPGRIMELQADALAGWYIGKRAKFVNSAGIPINSELMMQSFYSKGDYQFNSPQHHGTPRERLKYFADGLNLGHKNKPLSEVIALTNKIT